MVTLSNQFGFRRSATTVEPIAQFCTNPHCHWPYPFPHREYEHDPGKGDCGRDPIAHMSPTFATRLGANASHTLECLSRFLPEIWRLFFNAVVGRSRVSSNAHWRVDDLLFVISPTRLLHRDHHPTVLLTAQGRCLANSRPDGRAYKLSPTLRDKFVAG